MTVTQKTLEAKVGFLKKSNHFQCVISLFLLPSFSFSLLWQRQQTFVSREAPDLALPLVDPGKKGTCKRGLATPQQRLRKGVRLEVLSP